MPRGAGRVWLLVLALTAAHWPRCLAFYIPGVAPTEYQQGDRLELRVGAWQEREGVGIGSAV